MSKNENTWVRVKTHARTHRKRGDRFRFDNVCAKEKRCLSLLCLMNNHYRSESSLIFQKLALFWAQHDGCVCVRLTEVCVYVCTSWEPSSINSASGFQRREEGKINSAQRRKREDAKIWGTTQQKASEEGQECTARCRKTHTHPQHIGLWRWETEPRISHFEPLTSL